MKMEKRMLTGVEAEMEETKTKAEGRRGLR